VKEMPPTLLYDALRFVRVHVFLDSRVCSGHVESQDTRGLYRQREGTRLSIDPWSSMDVDSRRRAMEERRRVFTE